MEEKLVLDEEALVVKEAMIHRDAMLLGMYLHQARLFNDVITLDLLEEAAQNLRNAISRSESVGFIFGDRGQAADIAKLNLDVLLKLIDFLYALRKQAEKTPELQEDQTRINYYASQLHKAMGVT